MRFSTRAQIAYISTPMMAMANRPAKHLEAQARLLRAPEGNHRQLKHIQVVGRRRVGQSATLAREDTLPLGLPQIR
jgi:hypothetical protein